MTDRKDLVIIGSGPAGLSAAVYAQRAMLDQVVIEKEPFSGGQIITTERIDNYLGLYGMGGYELAMKFREHADALSVPFLEGEVTAINDDGEVKQITLASGETIETKAVLFATGARHKTLSVKGEKELAGAGVSYCATCDGAFFRGKTTAVVGGGDTALQDALFLANTCRSVTLIHRRDAFRASAQLVRRAQAQENIRILRSCTVQKLLLSDDSLQGAELFNGKTGETERIYVEGLFIAVGQMPNNESFKDVADLDDYGYIIADESCRTKTPGVFTAGDCRTKEVRQLTTAAADGSVAALAACSYIDNME